MFTLGQARAMDKFGVRPSTLKDGVETRRIINVMFSEAKFEMAAFRAENNDNWPCPGGGPSWKRPTRVTVPTRGRTIGSIPWRPPPAKDTTPCQRQGSEASGYNTY